MNTYTFYFTDGGGNYCNGADSVDNARFEEAGDHTVVNFWGYRFWPDSQSYTDEYDRKEVIYLPVLDAIAYLKYDVTQSKEYQKMRAEKERQQRIAVFEELKHAVADNADISDEWLKTHMDCVQNNPHHCVNGHNNTVLEHTRMVYEACRERYGNNKILLTVSMLHDIGKSEVKEFCAKKGKDRFIGHPERSERIASNLLQDQEGFSWSENVMICNLIETHENVGGKKAIKKYFSRHGDYMTRLHLCFRYCDIMGHNPEVRAEKLEELEAAWKYYDELAEAEI